jgi:hypothetical protein
VTSQPQPAAGEGRSLGQYLRPLRDLAAWALVGAPAVLLFVAIFRLIPAGDGEQFASRTQDSFYAFVNLATIFFPLAAVLLALVVQPPHPKAKLITVLAAVEYAVAAFFGVVFGILVGLIQIAGFSVRTAFEELLVRAAWLAVFGLAGYAVYRIWRGLFYVPKPQPQPGMYGQPQYGVPGTYPGQPGYGPPPPGYPPPGQSGQPSWNQPAYGGPPVPPPAGWGQQPPAATQPVYPQGPAATQPVSAQPSSAQPSPTHPASAQPFSAQPSAGAPGTPPGPYAPGQAPGYPSGAFTDPTQVVPRHDPAESDRTEVVRDDRPGFGPADQDPPRH